ncbi:MAG TPA: bifunctional 5,10-methylenetetrahydrofolate dehydrogenase/5,10-methenyltetrahydrofolate cyclohydrolase [Candidatus Fimihabitans intestinipullorum]|uniref:Bifunctional protein FolD n=1 Tax=Candidatus Fimihabitans intestinipullorum TaxID=2840820 RepID=A0A9D1L3C5_9BACT|nr:bifunctional 5,10-methylenetetrahydrofolate dehydrogenase/5,10-methenyltetrahydrofolate cyclohydrolase [Candidatus Fimihabitans intestinipullorum]
MNVDCRLLKKKKLEELKELIKDIDTPPVLAIIQVGNVDASNIYIRNKRKAAEMIGIQTQLYHFEENVTEEDLKRQIKRLNEDEQVNGIFIQLPIPRHLNEKLLIDEIDPIKDVDGLTTYNLGNLISGQEGLTPCTPNAVIDILDELHCDMTGQNVVVIGRSRLVGLPLFHLLLQRHATIDVCHSKTKDLKAHTIRADILVTAAGTQKNLITEDMVKKGSIIIDVSIIRDENNKLCGDVDYHNVVKKVSYITPVPGGVGQLTVLELMKNTMKAYQLQKKVKKHSYNLKMKDTNKM